MNILVVDDEPLARRRLAWLIEDLGAPYRLVAEAADGETAVRIAMDGLVDLVLMDIHMPGMDGLEAAQRLAKLPVPPAVIFTTAYEEHALPAFESHAVAYLLKPIRAEKLRQALEKVSVLTRPQLKSTDEVLDEALSVQIRGQIQRIPLRDVYYLQADHKYVRVRHEQGESLLEESLSSLEQRFASRLLRIHRNALVMMDRLCGLGRNEQGQAVVSFRGIAEQLPVSRRHLAAVRRWFKGQ